MENIEELERKIIEFLQIQFKKTGGANGTNLSEIDKILNMSIEDRNAFLDRMVKEKKIIYIKPLNCKTVSLPR